MKTLQECKDEVARKYGYNDWKSTDFYQIDTMNETKPGEVDAEHFLLDQAAELYARAKWDEACEAQKNAIVIPEKLQQQISEKEYEYYVHLSDINFAILNSPKPEFKP